MKKLTTISTFIILFLCSGITRANIDFFLSSQNDGQITIGYNSQVGDDIISMPLLISLSDEATFSSSPIVSVHSAFNYFIDFPIGGGGYGIEGPGTQAYSEIDINFATLDSNPIPTTVDNLITLQIQDGGSGFSYVTLSENLIRGGIIDTGGNSVSATFPEPFYAIIPEPTTLSLLALGAFIAGRKRRN